jgi:hypothetical protein
MKTKAIVLLLFLFISAASFSQEYCHFIDTTSKWSILTDFGGYYETNIYRFSSDDTLIDNVKYRKLYSTNDPFEANWSEMDIFIREDTVNKQVYLRNEIDEEGLIYDFSIDIGDTVTIYNSISGCCIIKMQVIEKDSVLMNGEYRNRFHFEPLNWPYWDTWVEGIGSIGQGFIYSGWYNTSPWYSLLCYKKNENVYYMHPYYSECYYPYVSINEISNIDRKPFYNRNTKSIEFKNLNTDDPVNFELFTINGQRIIQTTITEYSNINLSKYELKNGIYILLIKNNDFNFTEKISIINP